MLARLQKSMKEKDQGFTLIELLVVIIIIGILAAIAIPVFLSQREKGVQAGIKSDLKSVATFEETYYVDNAKYIAYTGAPVPADLTATARPRATPSPPSCTRHHRPGLLHHRQQHGRGRPRSTTSTAPSASWRRRPSRPAGRDA